MNPPPYYAHSGSPNDYRDWQPLSDHLRQVAALARRFVEASLPGDQDLAQAAHAAGLLHDLGKYRREFQDRLHGRPVPREKTYHKQAGAAKAEEKRSVPMAYAIAGHHGGMPDRADWKNLVMGEAGRGVAAAVGKDAIADCPELGLLLVPPFASPAIADLIPRILFSCLVDADWTDTGDHECKVQGWPRDAPAPCLDALRWLERVLDFVRHRATACKDEKVAAIRKEVLEACLAKAADRPGLFALTVPTGGGKTLSGLAFALNHASRYGLRRVIYVAPYLSILDQNARVVRQALSFDATASEVFEHHSLSEPPGDEDANDLAQAAAA